MSIHTSFVRAGLCVLLAVPVAAEPPRGSITIDRISQIKLGKSFESQIYPGEIHFFRRDIVLRDAWKRCEEFFDRTVRNGTALGSTSSSANRR